MTRPLPVSLVAAALLAILLVGLLVRSRRLRSFDDLPNARSLHQKPVGRLGGLGLFTAAAPVLAAQMMLIPYAFEPHLIWGSWIVGMLVLIGLGVGDDRASLPASWRLLIHLGCSAAMVIILLPGLSGIGSGSIPPAILAPLLILGVSWLANLYNFMDGSDGIAGLTAVLGFGAYAWLSPSASGLSLVSAAIAASTAGFLCWNWHPARIFLGDAGSLPLGWAVAVLGLIGIHQGAWPISTPLLIFFPFIFDATITMSRRALKKQRIWLPHREHAYQRLILSGASHRHVAMLYGVLMVPGIVTARITSYPSAGVLFAIWTVIISIHIGFYMWVEQHTQKPSLTT